MNKYSSKAVKTAATVGMSLAMVLSNAAPVFAAMPESVCKTTDTDKKCNGMIYDLEQAIKDAGGIDSLTMDTEGTIDGVSKTNVIKTLVTNREGLLANAGSLYSTVRSWMNEVDTLFDAGTTASADGVVGEDATGMFGKNYFDENEADTAQNGTKPGLVNYYTKQIAAGGDWNDLKTADSDARKAAVKAYEKMAKWVEEGDYDRLDEKLAEIFDKTYDTLEEKTADYRTADEDVTDIFVAAWTTVLEADLAGSKGDTIKLSSNTAYANKLKDELGTGFELKVVDKSSKSAVKARIQAIKDAPNYYRVKNEDAVQDIIDQYNELLGNITDLKDMLKTDAYKAYTTTKVEEALTGDDSTTRSIVKKFTADPDKTDKANATAWAKTLSDEQYKILKNLKEDVLDEVYNFETKKVGNYYVDKSGWVDGFTGSSTIKTDLGTDAYDNFFKVVDTKEGLFGIDVVLNHLADFVDSWDAVTTDIAKLTPANIKASDKATLEAAEDAVYEMTDKGKFVENLTKSQKKEIRKIQTKLDNLREAFDNLGVTNVAGWYDMGNGNWGYNNEDGTPAAYKWVASGSDWYMIKDGKMLRNTWLATDGGRWYYLDNAGKMVSNQSVDGCWINSYGVYMSPSYNG